MAITVDLRDTHLKENLQALKVLKDTGCYSDGELQKLYNKQVEADKRSDNNA